MNFKTNLVLAVFLLFSMYNSVNAVEVCTWDQISYDVGTDPDPVWVFSDTCEVATETLNADPALLLSNVSMNDYTFDGTIHVNTTTDDDFIGIVFGYQDSSHFYLMNWKQTGQNQGGEQGTALQGFLIKKFTASTPNDFTYRDFWHYEGTARAETLVSNFGDNLGWDALTTYNFHLEFHSGQFNIVISDGITELWNVTVNDGSYTSGRFGFFNFSQENTKYRAMIISQSVPTLSEWGMLILALLLLAAGTAAVVRWRRATTVEIV